MASRASDVTSLSKMSWQRPGAILVFVPGLRATWKLRELRETWCEEIKKAIRCISEDRQGVRDLKLGQEDSKGRGKGLEGRATM